MSQESQGPALEALRARLDEEEAGYAEVLAALDRLEMTDEKVMINIQRYGNTSAATVPIALDEAIREGRVEKGKLVVLVAFGAGLTWGATLLRW